MLWSRSFIPTLKETPSDAVAPSHQLLLRAGMIRQLGAGAYTYLPLGFRVLNKVVQIVRKEMEAAGALEVLMPALQPAELWKESGRYETFGDLLMQLKISGDQHMALGPTHEEVVTDLIRGQLKSYRQLPVTLYQIQTKFRDEPRPRFGVLRTREFIMKDAYSFDANVDQLNASYDAMYEAYCRIFDRCGLPYVVVEAESGPIGGDSSHEFMVPAQIGEDVILQCPSSGYAANVERARIGQARSTLGEEYFVETGEFRPLDPYHPVPTPGKKTIQDVAAYLKVKPHDVAKLLIYLADGLPVGVLLRGDHEANEAKVRRAFGASTLVPADPATIEKATGAPMGFLGPVGLKIPLAIDHSASAMNSMVTGGNALDVHFMSVVPGRDFRIANVHDLRNAVAGDPCPLSGEPMIETRGIEIGHVFKLGTKYSKAMGATFVDETGQEVPLIMGCYGIGINRILAAAVEAFHDQDGIRWPLEIAPYSVAIVPLQIQSAEVMSIAKSLGERLESTGLDVLVDDRDLRPGVKFKDVDLVGIPLRVVVSERGIKDGAIEVKWRHEAQARTVPAAGAADGILAIWEEALNEHSGRHSQRREQRMAKKAR